MIYIRWHSNCISYTILGVPRVNCPCPEQGEIRTVNFQVQYLFNSTHRISRSQSTHSKQPCEWFGDLQALLVKLEQILHLKVHWISALFGTGAVYPTYLLAFMTWHHQFRYSSDLAPNSVP